MLQFSVVYFRLVKDGLQTCFASVNDGVQVPLILLPFIVKFSSGHMLVQSQNVFLCYKLQAKLPVIEEQNFNFDNIRHTYLADYSTYIYGIYILKELMPMFSPNIILKPTQTVLFMINNN